MARTPANVTQADIARVLRAAKQTGAAYADVRFKDGQCVRVHFSPTTTDGEKASLVPSEEIVL